MSRLPMYLPRGALRITTVTRWSSGPSGRSLSRALKQEDKGGLSHCGDSTSGPACELCDPSLLLGASPRRDVVGRPPDFFDYLL